jgi:hypothetical protein
MTTGQRLALAQLTDGPKTSREVGIALAANAHGRLRRLEDRGLVRRLGDTPYQWELTQAGRSALELTT